MHRKARKWVGIVRLMVNLVDSFVQHLSVEESVGPVKVKISPDVHKDNSSEKYGNGHWAVIVDEEAWRQVGGQMTRTM